MAAIVPWPQCVKCGEDLSYLKYLKKYFILKGNVSYGFVRYLKFIHQIHYFVKLDLESSYMETMSHYKMFMFS